MSQDHLAIIGGTGLYELDALKDKKEHTVNTPFGQPSADIIEGVVGEQKVLFLPRHGIGHRLLPHEVNYRANIWALKKLGARSILSISATGSLREDFKPGDLALVSQYYDHTKGKREYTFFGNGIAGHIMAAKPSCIALTNDIVNAADALDMHKIHPNATYACVEGPRLGTRAESFFLKDSAKADLVGMTNVPECFLAREAQMGYATLAIITDYDCWMDDEHRHVSMDEVFKIYGQTIGRVKDIIVKMCTAGASETPSWIRGAIQHAILTPDNVMTKDQKDMLKVLRA